MPTQTHKRANKFTQISRDMTSLSQLAISQPRIPNVEHEITNAIFRNESFYRHIITL